MIGIGQAEATSFFWNTVATAAAFPVGLGTLGVIYLATPKNAKKEERKTRWIVGGIASLGVLGIAYLITKQKQQP